MGKLTYTNFNGEFVHSGAAGRHNWTLDYNLTTSEINSQIQITGTLKLSTTGLVNEKSIKCGISATSSKSGGDYGTLKSSGTLPSDPFTYEWITGELDCYSAKLNEPTGAVLHPSNWTETPPLFYDDKIHGEAVVRNGGTPQTVSASKYKTSYSRNVTLTIPNAGTPTFTIYVLIAEGSNTPKYAAITLNAPNYHSPIIVNIGTDRDNLNVVTATVDYALSGSLTTRTINIYDEYMTLVGSSDSSHTDNPTIIILSGAYPPNQIYTFTCQINDTYTTTSSVFILPTAEPWLSASSDHNGTGIGCVAEGGRKFEVGWDTQLYGDLQGITSTVSNGLITNLNQGTIGYAVQKRFGNVITLYINLHSVPATAGGANFATGKFNGILPPYDIETIGYYGNSSCAIRIQGENAEEGYKGNVTFRNASSNTQTLNSTGIFMNLTYIVDQIPSETDSNEQ